MAIMVDAVAAMDLAASRNARKNRWGRRLRESSGETTSTSCRSSASSSSSSWSPSSARETDASSSMVEAEIAHIRKVMGKLRGAAENPTEWRRIVHDEIQMLIRHADDDARRSSMERCMEIVDTLRRRSAAAVSSLVFEDEEINLLSLLPLAGQAHVLLNAYEVGLGKLKSIAEQLTSIERFYDSVGGVLGYQLEMLYLIDVHAKSKMRSGSGSVDGVADVGEPGLSFSPPPGLRLTGGTAPLSEDARAAVARGIATVPLMAEIYPMGGAADRLGLVDPHTLAPLPAAMLPYGGRSLLECLLRDLFAREYLHHAISGEQIRTPVAIMTSDVKNAHDHIINLCESNSWYGRGKPSFRLFKQPLVPMADAGTGRWLFEETDGGKSGSIVMKPGGHGALWKLCYDEGVMEWLRTECGRKAAFVRQVSNPMAGMDCTLFALGGVGSQPGGNGVEKCLGFATCARTVGASEGLNVLTKRTNADGSLDYGVGCVEYTEFERLAPELVRGGDIDAFPSNTNVLYVNLEKVEALVSGSGECDTLPGLIMNLNKTVTYTEFESGDEVSVRAGRLECTMQAIADALMDASEAEVDVSRLDDGEESCSAPAAGASPKTLTPEALRTFAVYNSRRHVTSSAKRKRKAGNEASIAQTPDGSFRDLMLNARDLLTLCGVDCEPIGSVDSYLVNGPRFIFLFHPALGPLWDVIAQKLRGGRLVGRSEFVLEVAEADISDLHVDGSFIVDAKHPLGQVMRGGNAANGGTEGSDDLIAFGHRQPRVQLRNVRVVNRGVDWESQGNIYWEHRVRRRESCKIVLEGHSAFAASDVTISGERTFTVPDGYCMTVSSAAADASGSADDSGLMIRLQKMDSEAHDGLWRWRYSFDAEGSVKLSRGESGSLEEEARKANMPMITC